MRHSVSGSKILGAALLIVGALGTAKAQTVTPASPQPQSVPQAAPASAPDTGRPSTPPPREDAPPATAGDPAHVGHADSVDIGDDAAPPPSQLQQAPHR